MSATKLPEFKGIPLFRISEDVSQADFLRGDFGKAVLEEYQARVKADYNDAKALRVLTYDDGVVKGSNPLAVCLVNQIVSPQGLRTATHADLEKILSVDTLKLQGQYEDFGLVLRSEEGVDSYLAKDLMQQLKARNIEFKNPMIFSLNDVTIISDKNSIYGVRFGLNENARGFHAPLFSEDGNFNSEDYVDFNTGFAKKIGSSSRTIHTRKDGLSGMDLGRSLDVYTNYEGMSDSFDYGRIVIVNDIKNKI